MQTSIDTAAQPARTGEALDILGAEVLVKSAGEGGTVFVADHAVPVGYGVPPHSHAGEDEMFLVLEGVLTLDTDQGSRQAGAGSFVHLPRGARHGFRNEGPSPARMIVLATPGEGFGRFFRALDAAGRAGALDPVAIGRIAADHGITLG